MVAAFSLSLAALFASGAAFAATSPFEDAFRAGLVALQSNDLRSAETNLQTASRLQPSNGRVWIALAQTWRKLHEDQKADSAAEQAARLAPADKVVVQSLAIYYSESGATLKAAGAQARYAVLAPTDGAARERAETLYFEAVQPLLKQEKFSEAIEVLEAARKQLAGSAQLELALGVAYYGLRRFDDAAGAFLRTVAINPGLEQPYRFLGRFLDQIPARLPEVTRIAAAFEKTNPISPAGYLLHARALNAESKDPEAALTLLQKALTLDGRDSSAQFELGTVFDRLQRLPDAVQAFEKATALDPSDPAAHYRLARDYERLGRTAEAQAERDKHARLTRTQDASR